MTTTLLQACIQAIAATVSSLRGDVNTFSKSSALKYDLWTGLDVLVNNAGILISSDFASVSMEEVDRSMQVSRLLYSLLSFMFVIELR